MYIHPAPESASIQGWDTTIRYQPKIQIAKEELVYKLRTLWTKLNKQWLVFKSGASKKGSKAFFDHTMEQCGFLCQELYKPLRLLYSLAARTGPLERSYSKLAKICVKDRSDSKINPLRACSFSPFTI